MSQLTRYEIVAKHADGRRWLIGYTPRRSRRGIIDATRRVGTHVVENLRVSGAISEDRCLRWAPGQDHVSIGAWPIAFSGRTQLDAKREGELPFIAAGRAA